MMLKKYIIIILLISCGTSTIFGTTDKEYIEKYKNVIPAIFNNLNSIVMNAGLNDDVAKIYKIADKYVKNENVIFLINIDSESVISGASFGYNLEKKETYITFGIGYLESYQNNSSIHYAILMHELRHLYDYITSHNLFISSKTNIKEEYWFELDALHIEAEFVIDYLIPKFTISKFENYLVASFKKDNLNRISLIMQREGMDVFFYLNRIENDYRDNSISKEAALLELLDTGFYYLDMYKRYGSKNDFTSYEYYINLQTYNRFLFNMLPLIINTPNMTWGEFFSKNPRFEIFHNKAISIRNQYGQFHMDFIEKLLHEWDLDIVKEKTF